MQDIGSQTRAALTTLWRELVEGAANATFVLNPSDPGLLASLDRLSADEASHVPPGHRASVAAHTDHLRYGLGLMNRWAQGEENPFATAAYSASWTRVIVTEDQWLALRQALSAEAGNWSQVLSTARAMNDVECAGVLGSVVHLAYHLGAMRQIVPALAGPRATD